MKKLLAFSLVSLTINLFGGLNIITKIVYYFCDYHQSNLFYVFTKLMITFAETFWIFGFPALVGYIFPKTKKFVIWIWVCATLTIGLELMRMLAWQSDTYPMIASLWDYLDYFVPSTLQFMTNFIWLFFGGIVFKRLTKAIDFSKFNAAESWMGFKNWYAKLSE